MENSSSSSFTYQHHLQVPQTVYNMQEKRPLGPSSSLHSVRKPPAKPWKKPDPPIPPKVYRVEPRGFRQLVQRLTGAPASATRRLRDAAPAPLDLAPSQLQASSDYVAPFDPSAYAQGGQGYQGGSMEMAAPAKAAVSGNLSPSVGMAGLLSPSLFSAYTAWCSYPVLSPGAMTSLEQSTVL